MTKSRYRGRIGRRPSTGPAGRAQTFPMRALRFMVSVYRGYLGIHLWAMLLGLVVVLLIGGLETPGGLLLVVMLIVYALLRILEDWLEQRRRD